MKKIKDERLNLVTLKNVRIAYLFQTVGILAIVIYTQFTSGPNAGFESPLFLVLILSSSLFLFLQMRVSADIEASEKKRKKPRPYYLYVILSLAFGVLMGLIIYLTDRQNPISALISGIVFFVCFLASYSVMYYLKKKRSSDDDDLD
ncbi:branched-chain amino acid ABC transporter substrate-binding protein [Sporolactobacillus shoreae]|uniref:Branched-chain amino acid ABC transporter substrate-binding protein n=1 Tax=Sporolactobacillus shoreae TaxID=1465501 RepID=A0A4Z0GIY9_9BACL|nr:branched-chain amino acid ABC transporter substrate-binding protein [Sporolactobacillus shoreae]TGA95835.1 branched-chain amino acid ABC transporter substrate-binding protein [Sporolactobacillus shoreae]